MFYEIYRNRSSLSDLGPSVIKLLKLQSHPVNLRHFAALFIEQLLASTCTPEPEEPSWSQCENQVKSQLNSAKNSAKLAVFEAKFTKRYQFGGPCPDPTFTGKQEFFKEFIANSTYEFVVHLKDLLGKAIIEKNNLDHKLEKNALPPEKLEKCIVELRVLAKFLGYIETLPYQKSSPDLDSQSKLARELSELRVTQKPTVDILQLLQSAMRSQKLIITVPWAVEYCSMLDPVSVTLQYYQNIFKQLIGIYKFHLNNKHGNTNPDHDVSSFSPKLTTSDFTLKILILY